MIVLCMCCLNSVITNNNNNFSLYVLTIPVLYMRVPAEETEDLNAQFLLS